MHFERWSLLLIGEALRHPTTSYSDFLMAIAITPDTLDDRLEGLVSSGLLERLPGGERLRDRRYELSAKGKDLAEAITALDAWSARWSLPVPTPGELLVAQSGATARTAEKATIEISLLGSFGVSVSGRPIRGLSPGSQRLLVFLALHDRAVARSAVAGTMWPESSEARAGISLRSALSRMDPATHEAILAASAGLALADHVVVDLRVAQGLARRLLDCNATSNADDVSSGALDMLSRELLPDWYDDWVVAEAEDWRQLRANALEALARLMTEDGRLADAAGAARAAIKVEPLRESAHAALIAVHLAEGNQAEALRVFDRFRALLLAALDLEPTKNLAEMVSAIQKV